MLCVSHASDVTLCDVNKDGLDDVIAANLETPGGATWTDSYVFISDGKNFPKQKILSLPTLGASGVSCGDLNSDGYPEIVFSNQHVTNERNLLSYVYWNDKGIFRFENHTQLQTQGSMANTIGDANNDGLPDVIFFNDEGYFRDGASTSMLYWGNGTKNYSIERMTKFYTHQIFGFGTADLDDDGNVEIIEALQNFISGVSHEQGGLAIEWNKNGKFDEKTNLTMLVGYGGVRIADINRDGYLDILGSGSCIDLNDPQKHGFPIFWGSSKGFSYKNRSVLSIKRKRMRGPLLMDLNKDGWLDIAGQLEFGKVRFWWGGKDGFSNSRFDDLILPRKDQLMYIKGADFNKDGWIDLLLPHRGNPD
ncbi:MAG: VCBS repeat-containing protein, partial [Ignavibacteriaceae bacterium]